MIGSRYHDTRIDLCALSLWGRYSRDRLPAAPTPARNPARGCCARLRGPNCMERNHVLAGGDSSLLLDPVANLLHLHRQPLVQAR